MFRNFKILLQLSFLKKKEFIHSFKKSDFWVRAVTVVFIIYLIVNSITTSGFVVQFVKSNFDPGSQNFIPVFNIIVFLLFVSNLIAIIFLGTAKYDQSSIKTLLRYPITLKQIIFFRTLSVSAELLNIMFIPFYIAAYFIVGNTFDFTSIILFLFILLLFLFCFNSIIEFLRNFTAAIISLKKYKFLFWFFSFALTLVIVLIIPKISFYFSNEQSIKKLSDILFYFPTGIFTKSIFALSGQSDVFQIFRYALYLFLFGFSLSGINLYLVKFYKTRDFGKTWKKKKLKEPVIPKLLNKTSLGPFEKKNIFYLYRSPRALLNILVFIMYEILLAYFVTVRLHDKSALNIYVAVSFIVLFQSLIILGYAGNFFAFDYSGIINYFFRPLKTERLIKSKILILNILVIFNSLVFIYFAFLFRINIYDVLLQINALIFVYFVSLFVAILLSLFFPKTVGFYAMMGMNAPFMAVLISMIISMGFWGLDYLLLAKINSIRVELTIIFFVFLLNLSLVYYKKSIFGFFDKILINQKEKIIDKLI
ncbi:hypothetical protein BMS3Abin04_02571 [bacterium BMS3Abin04]|nr:hypothetical protein BMS3Abin04_02571 [bacterium BMS3Abin04]